MISLDDISNKHKIAIISIGYNREESIKRLHQSLLEAYYEEYNNVPLVISIDCSNDESLYFYVNTFIWPFGDKYVIIH